MPGQRREVEALRLVHVMPVVTFAEKIAFAEKIESPSVFGNFILFFILGGGDISDLLLIL
jgi:hypothetical protein